MSGGKAKAVTTNGKATDLLDMPITLTAAANCAVNATVVLTRPNGTRNQLVEPIGGCKSGSEPPAKKACSNGIDDDGDGQKDDRDAAGATNPDPGCASPDDATENSEIGVPAGCEITWGVVDDDLRFPGIAIEGCGALLTAWIKPPGTPEECWVAVGAGDWHECELRGATVSWPLAETTETVYLASYLSAAPTCGPITAAVVRADGVVIEQVDEWVACD